MPGLVFMGGPMSVNDDLPWIPKVLDLIRRRAAEDVPMLGHCLGGQLMSKALGGVGVRAIPARKSAGARSASRTTPWRGTGSATSGAFESFHWHGETFTLPPQCHQAHGERLVQQPGLRDRSAPGHAVPRGDDRAHDRQLVPDGQEEIARDIAARRCRREAQMKADAQRKLDALHSVAERLYDRWIEGLKR